jgi:CPA2 family monovalent cation:H+ antiporter-2
MPRVLEVVASSRRRDLFVLTVLLVCAAIGWGVSFAGLSLALGAFLAGVVLADSEYGHQALADVLPLRDTFASVFFISIGMLLDTSVIVAEAGRLAVLVLAILLGKTVVVVACARLGGFPPRVGVLAGLALAHVGEFSFVLAQQGATLGLLAPAPARTFLAASVLSMLLAPLCIRATPRLADWVSRRADDGSAETPGDEATRGHVLILGYGLGGQLLAEALRAAGTRYAVVDIDADRVRRARAAGEPVFYGDATSAAILQRVGAARAAHVVLVLNDPGAALRVVHAVRAMAPDVPITVRSRYLREIQALQEEGATDVVAQEVEASLELIARVLRAAAVPRNVIEDLVRGVREGGPSERRFTLPRAGLGHVPELQDLKIESFLVRGSAWAAGRDLAASRLRTRTGASVIAVGRGGETAVHPEPGYVVASGDVLYLSGDGPQLEAARALLERGPGEA